MRLSMEQTFSKEIDVGNSPAYNIFLKKGKFKDRTAADILIKNPELFNELIAYYNELSNNINNPNYEKYRKGNMDQACAIHEACSLHQSGKLKNISFSKVPIWDATRTPDVSKTDKNGNTECRAIEITYDSNPNSKEPYNIQIMNCMAPPIPNSLVGAKLSQAVDKIILSMSFTEEAFYGLWEDTVFTKEAFARTAERERISYSDQFDWRKNANNTNIKQYSNNNYNDCYTGYANTNYQK